MRSDARAAIWGGCADRGIGGGGPALLASFVDAVDAYRKLLASGVSRSDAELARDQDYERLLRAGQAISRAGGEESIRQAVRLLAELVPGGGTRHFDRLWCGLFTR